MIGEFKEKRMRARAYLPSNKIIRTRFGLEPGVVRGAITLDGGGDARNNDAKGGFVDGDGGNRRRGP